MPYTVVKGRGERPWKIKDKSGRTVGSSKTRASAEASVRARMASESGKKTSRGISTGYNPETGKVGYTKSVKPKAPKHANYASKFFGH